MSQSEPPWQDPVQAEHQLNVALNSFDWPAVDQLTLALIERLGQGKTLVDDRQAKRLLSCLRGKRRFQGMTSLAEALLQAGSNAHQTRRQYAQGLIDQNLFRAAELVLRDILADPAAPLFERGEAQGLLGRISKQIYVNACAPANPRNTTHLQNAIDAYWLTYALNPGKNLWHGINIVSLLERGRRDGLKIECAGDQSQIAESILKTLAGREAESATGELECWDLATRMEAQVALGDFEGAAQTALCYEACRDADAFEIGATLRQFEQVWQLRDDAAPGDKLLPILRAALLQRQGGALELSPAAALAGSKLEKVFGADKSVSLDWYQQGLLRARSVARIEVDGKGFGTGWLFDLALLAPGKTRRLLVVTNAHVIGPPTPDRYPDALRPEDATVHFQMQQFRVSTPKVVFHSPVQQCDATFLELSALPADTAPMPVDLSAISLAQPAQRLYIIGHPGGRDLEFSLQDNQLLAAAERLVHYRTPSEGGSSGSPVFGPTGWNAVALHHSGRKNMPRLDGQPGTYEANEGIALGALSAAVLSGREWL